MLTATVTDATTPLSAAADADAASLGRQDFLKMLIAQLENQDPLNPQESTEFTAQLAQFSSLEQQISMRDSLGSINAAMARTDSVTAIGMIGQDVRVESEQFELGSGGAMLEFELDGATKATTVDIFSADGRQVATLDLGELSAGLNTVAWDGLDANGQSFNAGIYSMRVAGSTLSTRGDPIPIDGTPLLTGRISGADVTGQTPMLLMGNLILPLSSVREVYSPATAAASVQP